MPSRYEDALNRIADKFRATAEKAAKEGIIPYKSAEGKWIASPYDGNSWWTGGFWPGLMWQLWTLTGDVFFRDEARRVGQMLTDEFRTFQKLNHDVGFMYLLSAGADAKLTGNEQARTDTLHAASLLMGRFNPAGFIRAWNEPERTGYAIIDCMMNLALLYRASRETGDPRFRNTARIHADTTLREFLRPRPERASGNIPARVMRPAASGAGDRHGACTGSHWHTAIWGSSGTLKQRCGSRTTSLNISGRMG